MSKKNAQPLADVDPEDHDDGSTNPPATPEPTETPAAGTAEDTEKKPDHHMSIDEMRGVFALQAVNGRASRILALARGNRDVAWLLNEFLLLGGELNPAPPAPAEDPAESTSGKPA